MSLLGVFKKKSSHEEKVEQAYKNFRPDKVKTLFPGGKPQVSKIIISLAQIYNLNLEACDAKMYDNILSTYTDILIRRVVTQSTEGHIIKSLLVKHGDLVKDKNIARRALAYTILNMKNNSFALDTEKDFDTLDELTGLFSMMDEIAQTNADAEKENLNDSDYGLVPNKPVYTEGVEGSQKYLNRMKSASGKALSWKRTGSMAIEGINGTVDVYESYFSNGEKYKTVYINMYGSINSAKLPAGFIAIS